MECGATGEGVQCVPTCNSPPLIASEGAKASECSTYTHPTHTVHKRTEMGMRQLRSCAGIRSVECGECYALMWYRIDGATATLELLTHGVDLIVESHVAVKERSDVFLLRIRTRT